VDQFCDKLRDRLNAIEKQVQAVKVDVQAAPAKAEKALGEMLEKARARIEVEKERVDRARAQFKAWADRKVAEASHTVSEWKAKHEARKLDARAEQAEEYAEAAVVIALASVNEAQEAILAAVAARKDADAGK
jgi:hypothetical protein